MLLEVKITLKSDLSPGSGYSYAGVIDDDICYTEEGLPYIPARRIKGCLRVVAETIESEHITELFGIAGNRNAGNLKLSNAYLKDHRSLVNSIRHLQMREPTLFSKEEILRKLTHIKWQTGLGTAGAIQNGSLRSMRLINHYDVQGKENVFVLNAEVDDIYADEIERCFKALRHIGFKSTRGLGNVRCTVTRKAGKDQSKNEIYDDDEKYIIRYAVKNTQPLMLSDDKEDESANYISGTKVLGYMASHFEGDTTSHTFQDLFLNGKTIFSNVYLSINGERYYPAPQIFAKLKKTQVFVNTLAAPETLADSIYNTENGNRPKLLNGYYVSYADGLLKTAQVEKQVTYHTAKKEEDGIKTSLYSFEHIKEDQVFSGYIITQGKYVQFLTNTLRNHAPYFGKSRTAQYGRCEVCSIEIERYIEKRIQCKADTLLAVMLASDAIMIGTDCTFTSNPLEVKKLIAAELGLAYSDSVKQDRASTHYITGYNTKWNLKKPAFSAISAGSVFVYPLTEDCEITIRPVGEKTHEGFGEINLLDFTDCSFAVAHKEETRAEDEMPGEFHPLANEILADEIISKLYFLNKDKYRLNVGTPMLGRITRMVKQSEDAEDFMKRIKSIKSDNDASSEYHGRIRNYFSYILGSDLSMMGGIAHCEKEYEMLKEINGNDDTRVKDIINQKWRDYLLLLLTNEGYSSKRKGA